MNTDLQTILALLVVLAAVIGLVRSARKKRSANGGGCGGETGCPTDNFKTRLKK